jgi:hypothetical protein
VVLIRILTLLLAITMIAGATETPGEPEAIEILEMIEDDAMVELVTPVPTPASRIEPTTWRHEDLPTSEPLAQVFRPPRTLLIES